MDTIAVRPSAGTSTGHSMVAWGETPFSMESDDTVFYGVLETADLQACRMEDNALQVTYNDLRCCRASKQAMLEKLQNILRDIATARAKPSAASTCMYLRNQLEAVHQAYGAECSYQRTLKSIIYRAQQDHRAGQSDADVLQREIMLFSQKLTRARSYEKKMQEQKQMTVRRWKHLLRKTAQATLTRKRQIAVRHKLRNTENALLQRHMCRHERQRRIIASMAGDLGDVDEHALRTDFEHQKSIAKQNDDRIVEQYRYQAFLEDRMHRLCSVAGVENPDDVIISFQNKMKTHDELCRTRERLLTKMQNHEELRRSLEKSRFLFDDVSSSDVSSMIAAKLMKTEVALKSAETQMKCDRDKAAQCKRTVLEACEVLQRCSMTIDGVVDKLRSRSSADIPTFSDVKSVNAINWDAVALSAALVERLTTLVETVGQT